MAGRAVRPTTPNRRPWSCLCEHVEGILAIVQCGAKVNGRLRLAERQCRPAAITATLFESGAAPAYGG
jgi:hypothetical protein